MDRPGKLTMCVPITKPCSLPPSLKLELSVSRYVFLPPREPWEEKALCRPPPGRMFCISQNVPESTRSTTTSCECTRVTFVRAVYVAHCVYDFIALSSEWTNEGRKERKKEEFFFYGWSGSRIWIIPYVLGPLGEGGGTTVLHATSRRASHRSRVCAHMR